MNFMTAERLGMTYEAFCRLSRWERLHWYAFFQIKPVVEEWSQVPDIDIPLTEWRDLPEDKRQAALEYDEVADLMRLRGVSRSEFMNWHPDVRNMKIEFTRKHRDQFGGV